MKQIKKNTSLIVIFLIALFLRSFLLSDYPNGFFTDEVVSGYVGRFLLSTGHDLYGNFLPIFYFDKFGDFRSIIPMYITGIFTFIFGLNEFSVRFAPALFGAITVIPMYFFVLRFSESKPIALLASFLLAIFPWHIVLSRAQSEGIMGLLVFMTGMAIISFKKTLSLRNVIFGTILLSTTYLFYPPFRILTPLFILPLVFTSKGMVRKKYIVICGILFLFTTIIILTPWGRGRAEQTSLFSNKEIAEKIKADNENSAIALGPDQILLARIFHNKPVGYTRESLKQYFSYLSPTYLFFNGGLPYRYTVPETGLLFVTFIFFIGAFIFLQKDKSPTIAQKLYLGYILAICILPASLTFEDSPNIHRSFLMIIPLVIICAYGMYSLITFSRNKKMRVLTICGISILLVLEFIYFQHQYRYQAPSFRSYLRGDGMNSASKWIAENNEKYSKIYSTGYEDFAIYYLYNTKNFNKNLIGIFEKNPLFPRQVDNLFFSNEYCPFEHDKNFRLQNREMLVVHGDCKSYVDLVEVHRVVRRDSTVAFKMYVSSQ